MNAARRLDSFRRGSRFRLAHDPTRAGRVIDKSPSGVYVSIDRLSDRTFTTKDGTEVRIKTATEKVTLSGASPVVPYR